MRKIETHEPGFVNIMRAGVVSLVGVLGGRKNSDFKFKNRVRSLQMVRLT